MSFSKIESGLFNESIYTIVQDDKGFIWVGTQDGLHRYDGYTFEVLRNSPEKSESLAANWIRDMSIDSSGDFWLGTYGGGLTLFSPKTMAFTNFDTDSITDGKGKLIHNVCLIGDEYLISSRDHGFKVHSIRTKEHLDLEIGYDSSPVTSNGLTAWIGVKEKLFSYNPKTKELKHVYTFSDMISKLEYIPEIGLFVGFPNKVTLFSGSKIVKEASINGWPKDIVSNGEGDYLIATETDIFQLDSKRFELTKVAADFDTSTRNIETLFFDRQGSLWVGTNEGLYKEKKYNQAFIGPKIDLHARRIINNRDTLYVAGDGGLFKVKDSEITPLLEIADMQGLISVEDMIIASGYEGEVYSLRNDSLIRTLSLLKQSRVNLPIFGLAKDDNRRLWVGSWASLSVFDDGQLLKTIPFENKELKIVNLYIDSKDRLWIITGAYGLFMIDGISTIDPEAVSSKMTNYRNGKGDDTSLTSNVVMTMEEDDQGQMWFGTDVGVISYEEETNSFSRLKYQGALFDRKVMTIRKDQKQNIWITTINDGIYVYNKKAKTMHHYTKNDGLISNSFLFGSGFYDMSEKMMYFGTKEGIQQIDLSRPCTTSRLFMPIITDFQVNDDKGSSIFDPVQAPFLNRISLASNQNDFSISFSALDFVSPEKISFVYTIDNDPYKMTDLQTAYFTNVPFGKHILNVQAIFDGTISNTEVSSLEIYISPPWYYSNLAKVIYFLLFLAAAWGIYQYLKWRWKMRFNLKLKEEEAERLKQLNDFKSKVYTDIAHEFKTPLTLISGPIEKRLRDGTITDQEYTDFSTVQRNATRLTSLVDQLLQLATLENGKLRLQIIEGNLGLFLHLLCQAFEYKGERRQLQYTFQIGEISKVWYDEDIIEKITTNLLSNAFKYAPDQGICSFTAEQVENCVEINVKNTVRDSSGLQIEKFFNRFYQEDSSSDGMGVGLSLVKDLVGLYEGSIEAKLEAKEIIHFRVRLPLYRSAFKDKDIVAKTDMANNVPVIPEALGFHPKEKPEVNEKLPMVLIVEDNTEIRAFVRQALQKDYRILEAENGKEGLAMALSEVPDIILSDIRMPFYDGIQLCNRLKTDERTSHIPIILLTASTSEENEFKGLASGADDFVTKPFKMRILEQRIANLITIRKALRSRYSQEFVLKPKDIAITATDEIFLTKIQKILDEYLSDPSFNAKAFSRKAGMSRMQLHRKLLAFTGLSTTAFVRSQRLKLAVQFLQNSGMTINEVAYAAGFNTSSYFMTSFKEVYKKTPSEFLQAIQET